MAQVQWFSIRYILYWFIEYFDTFDYINRPLRIFSQIKEMVCK